MKLSLRVVATLTFTFLISIASFYPANSNTIWQDQMLNSVNTLRLDKGFKPLILCKPLTLSAQNYAKDLAKQNYLSHKGKDGSTPGDRIQKSGYNWENPTSASKIAENIAAGQNSVSQVMKDWRNSKGHYKNIIEEDFTHVGFGMAKNPATKYKTFWVQNFGFGAKC